MVLDRATIELPPLPDLVPGAVRQGRRRRLRARALIGVVGVASVAAIAAPTLLLAPWAGSDTGREGSSQPGELPLHPANWPTDQPLAAPTTAYPTMHVTPTKKGKTRQFTRSEVELRYAFKQKLADVITKLLPPDVGRIVIPDNSVNAYRLVSGDESYQITVRVDLPAVPAEARPGGAWSMPCAERESQTPALPCVDGRLPDGTLISVGNIAPDAGSTSPAIPIANFGYHGAEVFFGMLSDVRTHAAPPVTSEQVARLVSDPTFLEAVDFWRTQPVAD